MIVIKNNFGDCRLCGEYKDLRMGCCFYCADYVDGKETEEGYHLLWDKDNPSNKWICKNTSDYGISHLN